MIYKKYDGRSIDLPSQSLILSTSTKIEFIVEWRYMYKLFYIYWETQKGEGLNPKSYNMFLWYYLLHIEAVRYVLCLVVDQSNLRQTKVRKCN